jgi:hypothetical protein
MKSDKGIKAFVTFRLAGDSLQPDAVTNLLRVAPTHAHRLGEQYTIGRSTIVGKTGVWLFSTDSFALSSNLYDHVGLILAVLGLSRTPQIGLPIEEGEYSLVTRFLRLQRFLKERSLTATLTLFWHGPQAAPYPKVPNGLVELFELIPIKVEVDFDKDEDAPRRSVKVA